MTANIRSILIVDDSAVQRSFAADFCREFGCTVILEAKEGQDAMNILSSLDVLPDVAIVDLEMPGMDGMELVQQMYKQDFHIPLIIASGRDPAMIASVAHMIEALGLPLLGSMQKPIKKEPLHALLACVESD